ncbi:DUF4142 domain-containing protein [Adhaeribacter sp. BT258]|uniref:DUF4142 domain-containing protein n=1 Tax=Adhaeribacter terrigena TaxID=2793070 RepID=A0ABS1C045_9BACT|nr:DUF4142 domain-containing protein [Adhaeribacter terrigena]MBK0402778.1 DUF4142 domain-containing protein [Adhaeribacter terrigena]
MKKSLLPFIAAAALVYSLGACRSTNTDTSTTTTEPVNTSTPATSGTNASATSPAKEANSFVALAASFNQFELRSSELAGARALHPAARVFAKLMRDEHREKAETLKTLATKMERDLPATLLPEHQRLMEPMNEVNIGEKFDKRYLDAQIKAHEEAITLYENALTGEINEDLLAFARQGLPKLRDHLVLAKKAKDALD